MEITLDNRLGHEYLGDMRGQLLQVPITDTTSDRQVPSTCSTTKSTTPLQVVETGLSPIFSHNLLYGRNSKQEEPCQTSRLERLRRFRLLSEMDVLQDGQTIGKLSWLPTWAKSTNSPSKLRLMSPHSVRLLSPDHSGCLDVTWPCSSRGLSQRRQLDRSGRTGGHYFFGNSHLPTIPNVMAPPYVVTPTSIIPYQSVLNKSLGTSSRQIELLHQPLHHYQVPLFHQIAKGDSNAIT